MKRADIRPDTTVYAVKSWGSSDRAAVLFTGHWRSERRYVDGHSTLVRYVCDDEPGGHPGMPVLIVDVDGPDDEAVLADAHNIRCEMRDGRLPHSAIGGRINLVSAGVRAVLHPWAREVQLQEQRRAAQLAHQAQRDAIDAAENAAEARIRAVLGEQRARPPQTWVGFEKLCKAYAVAMAGPDNDTIERAIAAQERARR